MPNLELAAGTVALPLWVVAGATALFAVTGALTLMRGGASIAGAVLRVGTVVIACAVAGLWFNQASLRERAAERRALDQRVSALDSRAVAPGSPLACLDAGAGDAVETACEKAVFATPQSVAEAVSYVSARLALLGDATEFARRTGGGYDNGIATLRLAIETDRYGIVAHVLSVRNSCTPLLCDSYVLLHDPDRVQANLRERLFDHYIERYSTEWAARSPAGTPVADAAGAPATTASIPGASTAAPVSSKYDFPSAASIPPVSIMASEPSGPPQAKPDAKQEAKPETKPAAKAEAKAGTKAEAKPGTKAEAKPGTKAEAKAGAAAKRAAQQPAPGQHATARAASGTPPPPQPIGPPPSAPPGTP
jgi:hypothetical protein